MARIPQHKPQVSSFIPNLKVAQSTPQIQGVARARDIKLNTTPVNKLAWAGTVGQGIGQGIANALTSSTKIYDEVKQRVETIRVSTSQEHQVDIDDKYRDLQLRVAELPADELVSNYEGVVAAFDTMQESEEYSKLDAVTRGEVAEHIKAKKEKFKDWYTNRIIQKSSEANANALNRTVEGAKRSINVLPPGDLSGVATQIESVVAAYSKRNPQASDEHLSQFIISITEDLLTTAIEQWSLDNATTMIRTWDENPKFFKSALSNSYAQVTKKMKNVRETSNYDVATNHVRRRFGSDFAGAASYLTDKYNTTETKALKLTDDQYIELIKDFTTLATSQLSFEERRQANVEKEVVESLFDKYQNPDDGSWNVPAALEYVKGKRGALTAEKASELREQIQGGGDYTNTDHMATLRLINSDKISNKTDLLDHLTGKKVDPKRYMTAIKNRQDQINLGLVKNYYAISKAYFQKMSAIRKPSELPSGVRDRSLLVDAIDSGDFMRDLEAKAMEEGLGAGSPKIFDMAKEMLSVGSYDPENPQEFRAGESVGRGTQFMQLLPFGTDYRNIREWKHKRLLAEQGMSQPKESNELESALYSNKSSEKETIMEIATNGTPEQKAAIQKILEFQKKGKKMPLSFKVIQQVIDIMKDEESQSGGAK